MTETFEEVCKEFGCYCPEDWERVGLIANTPLWLRLWFVFEYKQKNNGEVLQKVKDEFLNAVVKLKNELQFFQYKKLVEQRFAIEQRLDEIALIYSAIFDVSVNKAREELFIEEVKK